MTADREPDACDPQPVMPIEDAVRALNAAQRALRAQQRATRQARHLDQLTALSRRRRAPQDTDEA